MCVNTAIKPADAIHDGLRKVELGFISFLRRREVHILVTPLTALARCGLRLKLSNLPNHIGAHLEYMS